MERSNAFDTTRGFSKSIGNEKTHQFNAHTPEDYCIPKPVYLQLSTLVKQLSIDFKNVVHKLHEFYLQDIIIEYKKDGSEKTFYHQNVEYKYRYIADHVLVGIPSDRYNWLLENARQLTSLEIYPNNIIETWAYTWVVAECDMSVECCVYSKKSDNLVPSGYLNETLYCLTSNVVGTGHFNISVVKSDIDGKHFLKFKLNRFQLKNKTHKTSIFNAAIDRVELPSDLMDKLNIEY